MGALRLLSRRSLAWGATGSLGLAAGYAAIVSFASGSALHLLQQAQTDWYLLLPLMLGFGLQISLVSELRRQHRLRGAAAAAGSAGTGASTLGMVACCAHHVADVAPLIGATGAATFLVAYRLPFIFVGLAITAIGLFVSGRRLAALDIRPQPEVSSCAA